MFRLSFLRLVLALLALPLLIAACDTGDDSPPACAADGLVAPVAISPDHIIVPDLRPILAWEYGDDCIPGGYRIEVTDYGTYEDSDTISGGASGGATTWHPADDLLPATDYEWRIAAVTEGVLGPYSQSSRFWTGPLCDASTMPAPTLAQPADGATVDTPYPPLVWTHAEGCLPEYYSVALSADGVGGPSLVADFHSPAKAVIPAEELADCTTYHWSVTAHRGAATPPISSTWSFSTNFTGACPGSGSASISGVVWHDLCAAPWDMQPTPEALPTGCRDRYNADGIREAGEPGLEGVRVDLGVGACPASGAASTLTAADGSYRFEELGAGTFCVSIDALSEPSTSALIPGGWSTPTLSESVAGAEVVVPAADSAVADIDFGWDFQFLPEPIYGPTPTPAPAIVTFNKNAFCRKGPNIGFKEDMAFSQGEQALALGRTDDGSWLLVKPLNLGVNCWVSASLADMPFDWKLLELKAPPAMTLASIGGVVWNDKCLFTGGVAGQPVVLGPGCVDLGDEQRGEFGANGVRDSGEPGFSSVRIQLGSGACPATGLAETTTGSDGSYRFSGLEPGTYCITLDVLYDGNPNRLIPGEGFTYPTRTGGTVNYWTIKVYYGDAKSGIDFGWEFQHLG